MSVRASTVLRSRLPVLSAVVVIALMFAGQLSPLTKALRSFYVPPQSPGFADTRTVTHSIDAVRDHKDPYVVRSYDPWHRVYNYPPIWLDLRYAGISSKQTNALGVLFAGFTLCCLLILFKPRRLLSAGLLFFATVSPVIVFAVERGNIDQAVFFLLVFALLVTSGKSLLWRELSIGVTVIFLTVLKLFPVVTAVILLRARRPVLAVCATVAAALAALLLTAGGSLGILLKNTPLDIFFSFGSFPVWCSLHRALFGDYPAPSQVGYGRALALAVGALAFIVGGLKRQSLSRYLPVLSFESFYGRTAICCLAVYCFVFAMGSNYNYRLIFLFGPLALLLSQLERDVRFLPASLLFTACLWRPWHLHMYSSLLDGVSFAVAANWLGTAISAWYTATMQPGLKPFALKAERRRITSARTFQASAPAPAVPKRNYLGM